MKKLSINFYSHYLSIILIIIGIIYIVYKMFSNSKQNIANLTDRWINAITVNHNSIETSDMFCSDGTLVGTVSRELRNYNDIKLYFDYFANLPGIKVISRQYNISKITSNVYLNTAFITWEWDGLKEPIVARMSFIFKNNCIYQLHSSILPELNEDLLKISGDD